MGKSHGLGEILANRRRARRHVEHVSPTRVTSASKSRSAGLILLVGVLLRIGYTDEALPDPCTTF
jgi:hypothetical protein